MAKIEEAGRMKESFRKIGGKSAEIGEREKKIIDSREFEEARNQGLADWDVGEAIVEEEGGISAAMDKYEPGEENKVNNAIGEID